MGPPSYMRSVVDRNFLMWHMTVYYTLYSDKHKNCLYYIKGVSGSNLEQKTGYPQTRISSTPIMLHTFHKYLCMRLFIRRSLTSAINLQPPNDIYIYICRTAPLTYRCCIYIFIQQIHVLNILNMLHTLCFFLFKMPFIS